MASSCSCVLYDPVWHCPECEEDFCDNCYEKNHNEKSEAHRATRVKLQAPAKLELCPKCLFVDVVFHCPKCEANFCEDCYEMNHKTKSDDHKALCKDLRIAKGDAMEIDDKHDPGTPASEQSVSFHTTKEDYLQYVLDKLKMSLQQALKRPVEFSAAINQQIAELSEAYASVEAMKELQDEAQEELERAAHIMPPDFLRERRKSVEVRQNNLDKINQLVAFLNENQLSPTNDQAQRLFAQPSGKLSVADLEKKVAELLAPSGRTTVEGWGDKLATERKNLSRYKPEQKKVKETALEAQEKLYKDCKKYYVQLQELEGSPKPAPKQQPQPAPKQQPQPAPKQQPVGPGVIAKKAPPPEQKTRGPSQPEQKQSGQTVSAVDLNQFDIEKVLKYVDDHKKHTFQGGKDLVLLIGKTGHGKSTTMNWLLGEEISEFSLTETINGRNRTLHVLTCAKQREGLSIGHKQLSSETFFVQGYKDPSSELILCDSPGLGDTKGVNVAIAHATAIIRILHHCESARVVLVLSANVFLAGTGRGEQLRQLLDEMQQFVNLESEDQGFQYGSLLVVYTHVGEGVRAQTAETIATNLTELQLTYAEGSREWAFLKQAIASLDKHQDLLFLRPASQKPDGLRKIIQDLPAVRNPARVFGCPLEYNLRLKLHVACKRIMEEVQEDLNFFRFQNVANYLNKLGLLAESTALPQLVTTYNETLVIVLTHFHRKLDAACRAFIQGQFLETGTHMAAISEEVFMHTRLAESKQSDQLTVEQRFQSLKDQINQKAREWAILEPAPIGTVDFVQIAQRLNWLQGIFAALSRHLLLENADLFTKSVAVTETLLTEHWERAKTLLGYLSDVNQWEIKQDGAPGNIVQCFNALSKASELSKHVKNECAQYYNILLQELKQILIARAQKFAAEFKRFQEAKTVDVAAEHKLLGSIVVFFQECGVGFSGHLEEAKRFPSIMKKLSDDATENDKAIGLQKNYSVLVGHLQKLEVESRILDTDGFARRLQEEYNKLERLAQRVAENLLAQNLATIKPDLDLLRQACFAFGPYLEQGLQLREASLKGKVAPSKEPGQAAATGGEEAVKVQRIYEDACKTLLQRAETVQKTITGLRTDACSLQQLQDCVTLVELLWTLRDHIEDFDKICDQFEAALKQNVADLVANVLTQSKAEKDFNASKVAEILRTVNEKGQVMSTAQGPRLGPVSVDILKQLQDAYAQAITAIVAKLAGLKTQCDVQLAAIKEKMESKSVGDETSYSLLVSAMSLTAGLAEHLDTLLDKAASANQEAVVAELSVSVTILKTKCKESLEAGRLNECDAYAEILVQLSVLKIYSAPLGERIKEVRTEIDGLLKAKKNDFSQRIKNLLSCEQYVGVAQNMYGAESMIQGTSEEQSQWSIAYGAIKSHFEAPYKAAIAILSRFENDFRYHLTSAGAEDIKFCLDLLQKAAATIPDLNKADAKKKIPVPEFLIRVQSMATNLHAKVVNLVAELSGRFDSSLVRWEFVEARNCSNDLTLLEAVLLPAEPAKMIGMPEVEQKTQAADSPSKLRQARIAAKREGLNNDIIGLIDFHFKVRRGSVPNREHAVVAHTLPPPSSSSSFSSSSSGQKDKPAHGVKVLPNAKGPIESKQPPPPRPATAAPVTSGREEKKSCTSRTCHCGSCEFVFNSNPLSVDSLFAQLHLAAKDHIHGFDDHFERQKLDFLNYRIDQFYEFALDCALRGHMQTAYKCLPMAHDLRRSTNIKTRCTKQERDLHILEQQIRDADISNKPSLRRLIDDPKKINQILTELKQGGDYGHYKAVVTSLNDAALKEAETIRVAMQISIEKDAKKFVPGLIGIYNAAEGLAAHVDDEISTKLRDLLQTLQDKMEALVEDANRLKGQGDTGMLDAKRKILVLLADHLRRSKIPSFMTLEAAFSTDIGALVKHIDSTISVTVEGWDLVRNFDVLKLDAAKTAQLIDYLKLIKHNAQLLKGAEATAKYSFTRAIEMIKKRIALATVDVLWSTLVQNCRKRESTPPPVAIAIQNLQDLTTVPEILAEATKDYLLKEMKSKFDIAATNIQNKFMMCCAIESQADQLEKMKELNSEREEVMIMWQKLSKFITLANSDELIVHKLIEKANKHKVTEWKVGPVAEYMVNCYRIGLNVSMADVKKHVHTLVLTALNRVKKEKIDLDDLAACLGDYEEGIGQNIVDDFDAFKANRIAKFKDLTKGKTFDLALADLVARNPGKVAPKQAAALKAAFEEYEKEYLELGLRHRTPVTLFAQVKRQVQALARSPSPNEIAKAVAGISSCMALDFAMGLSGDEVDDKTKALMNPHPVQILALLRLLRVDASTSWIAPVTQFLGLATSKESHLIQIGTGEGKSIVLGILSIFLALLGFQVDCVCYSEVLSRRDYEAFRRLFDGFGVAKNVFYGTFRELSKRNFNEGGDVRFGTVKLLAGTLKPLDVIVYNPGPRILLIDEVDVFFSKDFYGAVYFPAALIKSPAAVDVLRYIWKNKGKKLDNVKQSTEYKKLIASLPAGPNLVQIQSLFDGEFTRMINATSTYQNSPHRVEEGKIGIVEHGTIMYDLRDGYNTTCWYFQELDKMSISQQTFDENVGLNMCCGNFSYAEIPKTYQRILGVTGTLEYLGKFEQEIIKSYNIEDQTILPSLYTRNLKDLGIHIEDTLATYFIKIAHQATTVSHDAARATLIFFETEERMQQFVESPKFPKHTNTNVVRSAELLNHYVTNATKTGRITCFLRVFGRGIDFKCADKKVLSQGVHVIQTFLSEDINEEIQIKGRTCRQGAEGSYAMILLRDDLVKWADGHKGKGLRESSKVKPLCSADDLKAEHKEGLTKFLSDARNKWFYESSQARSEEVKKVLEAHEETKKFQGYLVDPTPQNQVRALQFITGLDRGASESLHIVFCLDESGSMSGHWAELQNACRGFLQQVALASPQSRISFVQFDESAEITGKNLSVAEAVALNLRFRGGGTMFGPALNSAVSLFREFPGFDPCLVFMTDGANGSESLDSPLQSLKSLHGLQSHVIFFGAAGGTPASLQVIKNALGGHFHLSNNLVVSFKTVAAQVLHGISQV